MADAQEGRVAKKAKTDQTTLKVSNVVPCLQYDDAKAAIDWLVDAFGYERQLVIPMGDNDIAHAELKVGKGCIMISSPMKDESKKDALHKLLCVPKTIGGCTQSVYVVVKNVDRHCDRAKKAGAEIISGPDDMPYGGRNYCCKDLEGYLWSVGSYDPYANKDDKKTEQEKKGKKDGDAEKKNDVEKNDDAKKDETNQTDDDIKPSAVMAGFSYSKCGTAIEWLCDAFGCETNMVIAGDTSDEVAHAQLTVGAGMIMLGSSRADDKKTNFQKQIRHPRDSAGSTHAVYMVVNDVDAHYERAKNAGAEIISKPTEMHYGGKNYSCKDVEGFVWSFGDSDPWVPWIPPSSYNGPPVASETKTETETTTTTTTVDK